MEEKPNRLLRTFRFILRLLWTTLLVILTIILLRAWDARKMADLEEWHRVVPANQFRAAQVDKDYGLKDYLRDEEALFEEVAEYNLPPNKLGLNLKHNRYIEGGSGNPTTFSKNWNRTYELTPKDPLGGVLLLHGLTDSPYSLRSVAEVFHQAGYYVLGLRLPGHGTVPVGLVDASWGDWTAAVEMASRHVQEKIGEDQPFILGGYSNGGPLALYQTLQSFSDDNLRTPERVFLFSPAIGISRFARVSNWHLAVAWIPYFEKVKWMSIDPEFDPYKYNSFPKNAAAQTRGLTRVVQKGIQRLKAKDGLKDFPPVTTFQSIADATVRVNDLLTHLYRHLPDNGSELVLFGVNAISSIEDIFTRDFRADLRALEKREDLPYELTVVLNRNAETTQMQAKTRSPGSTEWKVEKLEAEWPEQVYSLTHVAIPFPPDDPVYGGLIESGSPTFLQIGNLALRGEKKILAIPNDLLMRLRYNPFHDYMVERIERAIGG